MLRAWLFVPADQPDKVAKALTCGADAVILDLEDGVAPGRKAEARQTAASALREAVSVPRYIRVNAPGSAEWAEDLGVVAGFLRAGLPIAGVMLPKAEGPDVVRETAVRLAQAGCDSQPELIPLLETAAGIEQAGEIARAHPAVRRLAWGELDLALDLGLTDLSPELAAYARCRLVMVSRAAGLEPPLDAVCAEFREVARIEADARTARRLGFGGKLAIHPRQVEVIQRIFVPTSAERAWAQRVVAVYEAAASEGRGAVQLDGRMIDRPVYEQARRLLAGTRASGEGE
jgi:citrate lyase subunit beta/citryl-CoA lyase